jgi:hypothetical protein
MYTPLPTDVSGHKRDYQGEMLEMLYVMLPVYETCYTAADMPLRAPALIQEFNDMLEFAGATVTGVPDRAQAVIDYLNYHYAGADPPDWYEDLCQ